jgi:hypothetical protein
MKNYILTTILIISSFSCSKEIDEIEILPYTPASLDETAGTWKTFVLTSPDEILINEPVPVTDAAYLSELDSIKNTVIPNLSGDQKALIRYWGAGSVLRWNEIARELSAKYNIPPASNAEGLYPVPDPENPLADPKFPFANPPYTARALAYLSVAQYDALVSAWNYKYQFNRMAPFQVDSSIKPLLPLSDLPAYPSEDAVVAQASYVILLAMFPGEEPFLRSKLEECMQVPVWAGMNVSSDIDAGKKIGAGVAAKVMARAKTDGMGSSNNQSLTAGMIDHARSLGMVNPWISQESPARPPMLPNYGAVKTWNFDRNRLESIRPPMPYLEGSAEFKKDMDELKNIQKNQSRKQAAIANYWADGPGSYTPPGHWHRYAASAGVDAGFNEIRMARLFAYVGTALMDAGIACWDTKYFYYSPRPQQFGLKTSVGLPNFPSYTSGHSTFSFAAATVLSAFFPNKESLFLEYAWEASDSRVFGLIHYRIDCNMGANHGKVIGDYAVERAIEDGAD